MQAAPPSMRASPRQAPGGDTDRLAAKAITTPPMANTRPTLLRKVRGSIRRRSATSIVIRGVVESARAPRAARLEIRVALNRTGKGRKKSRPRPIPAGQEGVLG